MLSSVIFKSCKVTVTLQLLKMTLESVETSGKSFIITINFIVKSIRNQHLIRNIIIIIIIIVIIIIIDFVCSVHGTKWNEVHWLEILVGLKYFLLIIVTTWSCNFHEVIYESTLLRAKENATAILMLQNWKLLVIRLWRKLGSAAAEDK